MGILQLQDKRAGLVFGFSFYHMGRMTDAGIAVHLTLLKNRVI